MSKDPILVLQMQRMGDLILSFPLLILLREKFPGHPIWVVAEEIFFKGLMPVAPEVTFFPADALPRMYGHNFHMTINLSHRPEAAVMGRKITADTWFGARQNETGHTYIHGDWQLYKASLTQNNRHNQFHWSDLNILDILPFSEIKQMSWNPVHIDPAKSGIGLFLGASEPSKRPDATFWIELTNNLLKKGLTPVLLGGENERSLGYEVATKAGIPQLNLTGRFNIPELIDFFKNLQLLITPDTGPMHLAAWLGLPVLNLSMGPVNAWDTGPFQPAHLILRSNISCRGCWHCNRNLACHQDFSPTRIASLIQVILKKGLAEDGEKYLSQLSFPGQEMFLSARKLGLYQLNAINPEIATLSHNLLGTFWQHFYGTNFGLWAEDTPKASWEKLVHVSPTLVTAFNRSFSMLAHNYAAALKKQAPLPDDFWTSVSPLLRPLSGYLHLHLQNGDFSKESFLQGSDMLDLLSSTTEI